jgi:hypothetical protein
VRVSRILGARKTVLFAVVSLTAIAGFCLRYRAQRQLLERLTAQASKRGIHVELGVVTCGVFSSTLQQVKLSFNRAPGVSVVVNDLVASAGFFGVPRVRIDRLVVSLTGAPSTLYSNLVELPSWDGVDWATRHVRVEYLHRIFGRLQLDEVKIEKRGTRALVSAESARIGEVGWKSIQCSVARRNEMIELGVGDGPIQNSPIQVGYFPSSRGASQWSVTVNHQSARTLSSRVGWDLGAEFDAASVVGSLSFIVPDDPSLATRGSVQLAIDGFPKPKWPDAELLLGNTISFTSRIEPSLDMSLWDLPQVDVGTSLYSMVGVARVHFGKTPRFAADVSGALNCAQLNAHLPPSVYLNGTRRYLARVDGVPTASTRAKPHAEEARLRLQLSATVADEGPRHVAWHLNEACGLPELSSGRFQALDLPAYAKKMRSSQKR